MTEIPIPKLAQGPSSNAVLTSILEFDQYDDWVSDPLYYREFADAPREATGRLEATASIVPESCAVIDIPRSTGPGFEALILPIEARFHAYRAIGSAAARIESAMVRDKVFGFEYRSAGSPLFTPPGGGLDDAWAQVEVVRSLAGDTKVVVADVRAFHRSAKSETLIAGIRRIGVAAQTSDYLAGLLQIGRSGLPSVDDAFAYLHNFYLQPLDASLIEDRINFVRYRDEYFVFGDSALKSLESKLARFGLDNRVLTQNTDIGEVIKDLRDELSSEDDERVRTVLELVYGKVEARVSCATWDEQEKRCLTDSNEIKYISTRPDPFVALPRLSARPRLLDALQALPMVRDLHHRRRPGVLLAPPFRREPQAFAAYRKRIKVMRQWLVRVLIAGHQRQSVWQAGWAAAFLSDASPLLPAEVEALRAAANDVGASKLTNWSARLALARGSSLPADAFWAPPPKAPAICVRAAALGAMHLAQRGIAGPWTEVKATVAPGHPELVPLLERALLGVSV